jgi:hypothetical protein
MIFGALIVQSIIISFLIASINHLGLYQTIGMFYFLSLFGYF